MTKFLCKHCWQEIVPCKDHQVAKWQLADESTSGFMRWTCLAAPQQFVYNPRGTVKTGKMVSRYSKANKGSVVVGLHEPDRAAIAASLTELYSESAATGQRP